MAPTRTNTDDAPSTDGGSALNQTDVQSAAIVIHSLTPGGGERVVTHLASRLPQRSVRTRVICLANAGPLASELDQTEASITTIGSAKGYDFGAIRRLARALRQFAPDVINCHDRSSLPYVVLANLFARRRPVVYTAHGLLFNADREPRRRHRLAMKGVMLATAVSEQVARRHADYLGWNGGFTVIPNGVPDVSVDTDTRRDLREELCIDERAIVFLAVGNARPEKAFEDLLDATASLVQSQPGRDVRVLVAGKMDESPYCRDLLARRQRLGLESAVQFLGYRDDASRLYSAADVFVLSSRSEGLPMVLLEAMTAGLAVVATRVGGVPDATPKGTALLVDPAAPQELAKAMAVLADDDALRRRLGAAARQAALAKYGVETMVSRYIDVYAQAAAGKKRRRTATDAADPGEIR